MNNSKNIYIWLTIVIAFILSSCMQKEDYEGQLGNSGNIILNFSVNNNILTKAQDLSFESKITHADVFIFNPDGTSRIHYERMTIDGATGTKVLGKKLTELTLNEEYNLYVIANSTATTDTLETITTVAALKSMVETTTYINITGSTIFTDNNGQAIAPQTFLMTYQGTLQNDGTESELQLPIDLDRAAAKLTFNFKIKGKDTQDTSDDSKHIHSFGNPIGATVENNQITLSTINTRNYTHASYYLRNMPYTTCFYGENNSSEKRKTNPIPFTDGGYMTATPDTIAVTVYVYSCSWGDNDDAAFAATPFLIMNLPIVEITDTDTGVYGVYQERNYYEIPLRIRQGTNPITIDRNNHYVINATIDAPGGLTSMEPFPIVPVSYYVYPWNDKSINVGGSKEDVTYLNLSTNYIEMHNTTSDNSLKFASSSDITVSLQSAYYIDKSGNQIDVKNSISSSVTAVATSGMNGNITINAPLPENDAVRYMTFKATNGTQQDKTFTVVQYPLLYIFNTVGWYSYREDMKHTNGQICHYQNKQTSGKNVTKNDKDGFNFRVYDKPSILFWQGNYGIYVYADEGIAIFNRDGWKHQFAGGFAGGNVTYDLENPRMYHINIAATSKDYVLGKPLLDNDETCMNTPENAKMVSPSFMIASQLGTLNGTDTYDTLYYNKAKNHCLNYVETYILNDDGDNEFEENRGEKVIHLDDWRLPTKEEINIIVQNQTGDAMDNLLIGEYYICITGDENAPYTQAQASTQRTGYYTRCVRDAYDDKTPKH